MLESVLSTFCLLKYDVSGTTLMIVAALGAIMLFSNSFALNASLEANTKTKGLEVFLFGVQIAVGALLLLVSVASKVCN